MPVGPGTATGSLLEIGPLEREALSLVLRYPALTAELPVDEPLPFRDATAGALVAAWRERVAEGGATAADLEAFVGGLDPATAGLARDLLATGERRRRAARPVRGACPAPYLSPATPEARIGEAIHDGQLLLAEAQRDEDHQLVQTLNERLRELGVQRNEIDKAMEEPAPAVGARRN